MFSKLTRIRLELGEYSFTVDLRGKENYFADALQRITTKELKDITGNIMKVTSRLQSSQKYCAGGTHKTSLHMQSIENVIVNKMLFF